MDAASKAKKMIGELSMKELVFQFELTTNINDPGIPTVRGWIMEEIEKRDPEGFNKFLESETCEDHELRNYVL